MIGQTIAHYRVTAKLGAGGMGVVYRATDSKLGRDVALKILPAEFAQDAQRMQRFQREAQLLASLNHPNIATIHGLEESGATRALVMELVEGPTLAERIAAGAIPMEDALPIARQLAEGLEYAHDHGIIHRDLKPANIKLTADGKVKILDFGLAKALGDESASSAHDAMHSPTLSLGATKAGVVLGTAAYMSPEQARGKRLDKRADIWAFGVVLYEMFTGRQAYPGETASDSMAAVMMREPDWGALPAPISRRVRELLRRCLVKDEKRRLRDIGDARIELEEAALPSAEPVAVTAAASPSRLGRALPWAISVTAIAVAGWALGGGAPTGSGSPVMHLTVNFPSNVEPISGLQGGYAISPDGRTVAMIGTRDGVRRLYLRRLDRLEATEISNTDGANAAAFSPDGLSVAFVPGSGMLTRISLVDQQRTLVTPGVDFETGIFWSTPGIVFGRSAELWVVSPQGGEPRKLTGLDAARREVLHGDPLVLPGGRTLLFSSLTSESGTERIEALALDGGKRFVVVERAVTPIWSPTGHLLFGRDGAVWAVAFDPVNAVTKGDAVRVVPAGVVGTVRSGSLAFQLAPNGTVMYVPADFDNKRLVSVGRDGSAIAINLPMNRYGSPRISPDGRRLMIESELNVIVMMDLARGTSTKLMSAAHGTSFSTWSADGQRVAFRRFNVPFWAAADGSGKAGSVPGALAKDYPSAPGPDSDSILAVRISPETSGDIYLLSLDGKVAPKPLLATPAYEGGPQLSPDGKWLLYQSNETGQPEIHVRRYPAMDRQWQISEGGGVQARWGRTGREVFYRTGKRMMTVTFNGAAGEPAFGRPAVLFDDEYSFGMGISIANYDVTQDGRFIMLRRSTSSGSLGLMINWTEELKRLLAAGGVR